MVTAMETDRELERGTIQLTTGETVEIRPIAPSDRDALREFHRHLRDRSVYHRFFHAKPELEEIEARRFTEVDGIDRFALVALDPVDPETIIGVVRYDREPGESRAEYAAIVTDAWQGKGLGLEMTRRLIAVARRNGIDTLVAIVLTDNQRMLHLLRELGLPRHESFEGITEEVEIDLRRLPID
jgi:RimJ/RimL family protein N-acetyltransferase